MSTDLKNSIETYLAEFYPNREKILVSELSNISDGWESEMYSFVLSYGPETSRRDEKLVLRIYPGDNSLEKSQREFTAMSRLFEAGYPVPRVFAIDSSLTQVGRPFIVMEWIDGQVMWSMLDTTPTTQRTTLIKLFCNLFIRLHDLDWRPFAGDDIDPQRGEPTLYVDNWFVQARDALRQYSVIDLHPVLNWLEARRDALYCHRPCPVHQDFHPGNVLVGEDDQAVVIDWTGFDVSDYRFDLAWTLVLVHAYSGQELRDAILEEYEKQRASPVEEIETFEVFACARRLFDVFVSLSEGAQRLGMRPEAVKAMKQQMPAVERVYQLLVSRTGIALKDVEELIQQER